MTNTHKSSASLPAAAAQEFDMMNDEKLPSQAARNILLFLCLAVILILSGFVSGVMTSGFKFGFAPMNFAKIGGGLLAISMTVWGAWMLYQSRPDELVAPRVREKNRVLVIGGAVGGVIGVALFFALIVSDRFDSAFDLFGNSPLPAYSVIFPILVWLIAMPLLTLRWLSNIDEHEMRANNAGALAALNTYFMIAPVWWLGSRGGLLPEPQTMLTFAVVTAVYGVVWFWRHNR